MARRAYSDTQVAAALAVVDSCGGNILQSSRESGVPRKTLEAWVRGRTKRTEMPRPRVAKVADTSNLLARLSTPIGEEMAELRQIQRGTLAEKFEAIANQCCDVIPDFLSNDKTTLAMVATTAAVATDKMRLLREQSTANIAADVQFTDDRSAAAFILKSYIDQGLSEIEARTKAVEAGVSPDALPALDR